MIGWKAKAGYLLDEPGDTIDVGNIVITDDTFFYLHNYIEPFSGQTKTTQDPQIAYDFYKSYLGVSADATFSTLMPGRSSDYNNRAGVNMASAMPSIKISSPNLYQLLLTTTNTIFSLLYIPSLKVILYLENVYTVNGNVGTIVKVGKRNALISSNFYYPYYDTNKGARQAFVCYKGDSSPESLTNLDNYSICNTTWSTYNKNVYIACNKITSNAELHQAGLDAIFKHNYSPPDTNIPDNPYEPGGPSGPGGGDGSFDNDSDQIVDSTLPPLSSANTGFTRIYNPSLSQVQDLARYLWTDSSIIETIWNHIKQFFENPMEAIIGFNLVPVPVPNGGTQNFALMYIDTGVEMTVAASQFVDVDCGTFELKEYYGSALDYAPNTKVSCFLPFIGTVSLNTDEVMGRTLQVKYRVDICSGSCVAKIAVDGNFIYQYSGHCAINIPISSADFSSYVSSAISVAQLVAGAIAAGSGGVMASSAVDATQQTNQVVTTTQITNTARNPATGRQITTGTMTRVETRESPNDQSSTQASFSGLTPQNISNTVGQIMSSKPNINHSGSFSGNSGYLGVRRPFLIIERPNMCMPSNFQALNGFPSMITLELSSCKGFTRVQQVQLTGFYATNPEQAEILQLLKSGVIL